MEIEKDKKEDYLLDRYTISTIIRLNYAMHISTMDTVKEILASSYLPTTIILTSSPKVVQERLAKRDNLLYDEDFFNYENVIYSKLAAFCDKIFILDNSGPIIDTIKNLEDILQTEKIFWKRRTHERKI